MLSLHCSGKYSDAALVAAINLFFELVNHLVAVTLELAEEFPYRRGTDLLQTFAISATECHHLSGVVQGQDQMESCSNQASLA
jgi:hypothetical protein